MMGLVRRWRRNIDMYRCVMADPRCPRPARWLLAGAVAYALSPVDLIPDWIPVIGLLDDIIIVPLLIGLAVKMVPGVVMRECRMAAESRLSGDGGAGAGVVEVP